MPVSPRRLSAQAAKAARVVVKDDPKIAYDGESSWAVFVYRLFYGNNVAEEHNTKHFKTPRLRGKWQVEEI